MLPNTPMLLKLRVSAYIWGVQRFLLVKKKKKLTACAHAINIKRLQLRRVWNISIPQHKQSVFHTLTLPSGFLNGHLIIHRLGKQQWLVFWGPLLGECWFLSPLITLCGDTEACRVLRVQYQNWKCSLLCRLQFCFQVWTEVLHSKAPLV